MALLAAGLSTLGLSAATADDGGLLRLAQLSPDTPAVDVYVGSVAHPGAEVVLHGLSYGTVSAYREVPAGTYTVALRASGAAASTPPALSTTVQVRGRTARTVAAVGSFATLRLQLLPDGLARPPTGKARVRVIASAATATTLDVFLASGASVAARLPFAHFSEYVDVPAGATTLEVGRSTQPVTLAAGSVYSVLVLDKAGGGLVLRTVLDAASPAVPPVGGVETGAGGAAPTGGGVTGTAPAAAAGIAVLAAVALAAARRSGFAVAVRLGLVVITAAAAVGYPPAVRSAAVPAAAVHPVQAIPPAASHILGAAAPSGRAVRPVRVRIPALGIDSALARLGTDAAGALVPPANFAQAGWFAGGPLPGATGPAVIAGHVDSVRGPAVFFRLAELRSGNDILVTRADGTSLRFTVTRVARYPKSAFPTAEVYGPTADPQLRLITCGGVFDRNRRSYVDDVVVFARLM